MDDASGSGASSVARGESPSASQCELGMVTGDARSDGAGTDEVRSSVPSKLTIRVRCRSAGAASDDNARWSLGAGPSTIPAGAAVAASAMRRAAALGCTLCVRLESEF